MIYDAGGFSRQNSIFRKIHLPTMCIHIYVTGPGAYPLPPGNGQGSPSPPCGCGWVGLGWVFDFSDPSELHLPSNRTKQIDINVSGL